MESVELDFNTSMVGTIESDGIITDRKPTLQDESLIKDFQPESSPSEPKSPIPLQNQMFTNPIPQEKKSRFSSIANAFASPYIDAAAAV